MSTDKPSTNPSSTYFQQVAEQWDAMRSGYFSEEVRKSAIAKAYLRPEMTVADVGAGTGFMSAGLAPLVDKVYALDGAPAMLEVARKNLQAFSNVEYLPADGLSLPLPDGSVDAVFANMYLHHCPDPLAAIREMARLLKPGGRLIITDMDEHPYAWMKEEMADVWQGFTREQVRDWYVQAGLVNVLTDCTGQSCCAKSGSPAQTGEPGRTASISVFVAAGSKRIAARAAVEQAYAAAATSGCGANNAELEGANHLGYPLSELSAAPLEAQEISLGCGNPLALAALQPGEVVLDIGSGGGLDSFLSAQRVGPQGRVIGVDMTPAMLERARQTAAKYGLGNVEFRQGQADALPVEDGLVDVVISNCAINLTEDKGKVFREALRVLKPGGRLEVSDVVAAGGLPLAAKLDADSWASCVSGALPEREYLDLIEQAGFQQVSTRRRPSDGEVGGVELYSLLVSARKPA